MFDDFVSVFDRSPENHLQPCVRIDRRNVLPFRIAVDVASGIQTLHSDYSVGFVYVDECDGVFHSKLHEVIDPLAKLGDFGSLAKQIVMGCDGVVNHPITVVE